MIDFQLIQRQSVEHGQRRVPRSKVVERDGKTQIAGLTQNGDIAIDISEGNFFRNLNRDGMRTGIVPFENPQQGFEEIRGDQLRWRHVDRQLLLGEIQTLQRFVKRHPEDFIEQAQLFRDGNKVFGAWIAFKTAIRPPGQQLIRDDVERVRICDGLHRCANLAVLDRRFELNL